MSMPVRELEDFIARRFGFDANVKFVPEKGGAVRIHVKCPDSTLSFDYKLSKDYAYSYEVLDYYSQLIAEDSITSRMKNYRP